MRPRGISVCAVVCLTWIGTLPAQEREDRTLLPWEQMRAIINEASGDRAMHHLLELVPYPRVRPTSEYTGHFRESEAMARFAREYGFSDVRIESFPTQNRLWQPTAGELWLVEPEIRKTQFRRAAVVGVGSMAVLASGGDELATRVTSENLARGTERMGQAQRKGTGYIGDAADAASLAAAYREAWVAVRHQAAVEKSVVSSSKVLYVDAAAAARRLAMLEATIDKAAAALHEQNRTLYGLAAARLQAPALTSAEPRLSDAERRAARIIVERVPAAPGQGGGLPGGRGAGGGRGGAQPGARGPAIPQLMSAELNILLNRRRSVLEIRDFLAGEFDPLPLEMLMEYLKAQEAAGRIRLVERATGQQG